jgi:small conductance mechanosensitive channel
MALHRGPLELTDLETRWDHAADVAVTLATTYGLRVIGAIIILVAGWVFSRFVYSMIVRMCGRSSRFDPTITYFLANGARHLALVLTFAAVLTTFDVATASLVAVLGALGIAIGLALQGTLSNLAAGIMLILFRPFHIGDQIETTGIAGQPVSGTTRLVNLFYTEIDTDDKVRVVIPNGKLWGEIVRITTRDDRRRLDLRLQRPANDDIAASISRLREVMQRDRRISEISAIGIDALNDNGYVLTALLWVEQRDFTDVRLDLNRAVKEAFDRRPAVDRRTG